jgi:predicted peptidase
MKTTVHLLIAFVIVFFAMKATAESKPNPLSSATLDWKVNRSGQLKYLLYLPPDYKAGSQKRWPLMLFLHGSGERGSDVQRVAVHGPLKLVEQGTNFPFIIVAPQCPENQIWENEPLLQLLDSVEKKYAVDTKRVYLTGLSMGGYGTWQLGLLHPDLFAAIVPICGGCNLIDVLIARRDNQRAFKSLPVWAFHGGKDDVVPLSESERIVEGLNKAGVKEVKFTIYPDAGHNSWTEAYNNPELYEWMLKHSR